MSRQGRLMSLVALALAVSCSPAAREAAPVLTHSSAHVLQFASDTDTSYVELDWPRFTGGAPGVADSLAASIRAFVLASWGEGGEFAHPDSLTRVFFADHARLAQETGFASTWFLDRNIEVVGDTLGTISLALSEASYLGGAHPNSFSRLQIRDRRDGRRLSFADLFREAARDSLSAVCEPYFRTARGLTYDAALDTVGFWFEGGRFRVNDNVAITAVGLRFRFDPYEVAPHSLGPTEFVVPYAAVRTFARAEGPLTRVGR